MIYKHVGLAIDGFKNKSDKLKLFAKTIDELIPDRQKIYWHGIAYRYLWQVKNHRLLSCDDDFMKNAHITDWAIKEQARYVIISSGGSWYLPTRDFLKVLVVLKSTSADTEGLRFLLSVSLISKVSDWFFKFIDYLAVKFDLPTSYYDPRSPVYEALNFDEATLKRLTKRAEEVFAAGDHDKAINILKYVLSKSPEYHPALNDLATILFVLGEVEKSLAVFARAHKVCKTDRDLLLNYAEALKHIGKDKEAEELIKKAKELEGSPK